MDLSFITAVTALVTTAGNIFLFYRGGKQVDRLVAILDRDIASNSENISVISDRFEHAQKQMDTLVEMLRRLVDKISRGQGA